MESILEKLKKLKGIKEAMLVSRSGMHIAGKVPEGSHMETFVAMSAILLGASETVASELREGCKNVMVFLENSKIYITGSGPKALLVLKLDPDADLTPHLEEIKNSAEKLGEQL